MFDGRPDKDPSTTEETTLADPGDLYMVVYGQPDRIQPRMDLLGASDAAWLGHQESGCAGRSYAVYPTGRA